MEEFKVRMLERAANEPEGCPRLAIEAWFGTIINSRKSKLAGHEIREDCPWIRITIPGETNKSIAERPWTDEDKKRFPTTYKALTATERQPISDGMPLESWPRITRAMAMNLRLINIHTVEALAEVNDSNIGNLGNGGRDLREKAKAFLDASKTSAAAEVIADLQRQVAALTAGKEATKRGPGRPRKAA